MQEAEPDASVRDLVNKTMEYAAERGQHLFSFDFPPEELGDHVLITIAIGKDARNSVARLFNTFMTYEGESGDSISFRPDHGDKGPQ